MNKGIFKFCEWRNLKSVEVEVMNNTTMNVVIERRGDEGGLSLKISVKGGPELSDPGIDCGVQYHTPGAMPCIYPG